MTENKQNAFIGPMRLPFLVLPPVCVLLGTANASYTGHSINFFDLFLILLGTVLTHISVNALNEYDDFKSGLDLKTTPTPFSGGSGALPQNPGKSHIAAITGWCSLLAAGSIGLYFLKTSGLLLLPVILLGAFLVITYTKYLTRKPIICLIAPGLAFGTLIVVGTHFVFTGEYSFSAFFVSLVPFFLVNNLLLLNQFPDVHADKELGRNHIPIVIGVKASVNVYGAILFATYLSIFAGYYLGILPGESFLATGTAFIAFPTFKGVKEHFDSIPELIPYMGKNVLITILTPALLAISLLMGS